MANIEFVNGSELAPHTARNRKLFAPQLDSSTALSKKQETPNYDHLFRIDDEETVPIIAPIRERKRDSWKVTESTRQQAVSRLERSMGGNQDLVDIINKNLGQVISEAGVLPGKASDIVDQLRTNPTLRLEAGEYFLNKINRLASIKGYMPARVENNSEKGLIKMYTSFSY